MIPAQVIVNGLIIGSLYALIAIGFTIVYNQLKFINLFHGALYLFSSYILFFLFVNLEINFVFSSILAISMTIFLNIIVTRYIFQFVLNKKNFETTLLIASFVLLILFQNFVILFFNSDPKVINFEALDGFFSIFHMTLSLQQASILLIVISAMIMLYYFLYKTTMGLQLRAVSSNAQFAEFKGINSSKMVLISATVSSFFAGLAGVLVTLEQNIEPNMGLFMIFKGVTATIAGGSKIHGAVIAALFIGVLENISVWFFPSGYKNLITFLVLIIVLFFKPQGLFGAKLREEVAG